MTDLEAPVREPVVIPQADPAAKAAAYQSNVDDARAHVGVKPPRGNKHERASLHYGLCRKEIDALIELHDGDRNGASETIGYSKNVFAAWEKADAVPVTARLAILYIIDQMTPKPAVNVTVADVFTRESLAGVVTLALNDGQYALVGRLSQIMEAIYGA